MDNGDLGIIIGIWLTILAYHAAWSLYGDITHGISAMIALGVLIPLFHGVQYLGRIIGRKQNSNEKTS